ncbi:hypothetical protein V5799_022530 [Amblyomma americanum]|uniref:Uncharacterized protein n=1 Tax=Amblyomma americanum TaxID=6943 RepID=A0AAQ4FKQ4_AMBAM
MDNSSATTPAPAENLASAAASKASRFLDAVILQEQPPQAPPPDRLASTLPENRRQQRGQKLRSDWIVPEGGDTRGSEAEFVPTSASASGLPFHCASSNLHQEREVVEHAPACERHPASADAFCGRSVVALPTSAPSLTVTVHPATSSTDASSSAMTPTDGRAFSEPSLVLSQPSGNANKVEYPFEEASAISTRNLAPSAEQLLVEDTSAAGPPTERGTSDEKAHQVHLDSPLGSSMESVAGGATTSPTREEDSSLRLPVIRSARLRRKVRAQAQGQNTLSEGDGADIEALIKTLRRESASRPTSGRRVSESGTQMSSAETEVPRGQNESSNSGATGQTAGQCTVTEKVKALANKLSNEIAPESTQSRRDEKYDAETSSEGTQIPTGPDESSTSGTARLRAGKPAIALTPDEARTAGHAISQVSKLNMGHAVGKDQASLKTTKQDLEEQNGLPGSMACSKLRTPVPKLPGPMVRTEEPVEQDSDEDGGSDGSDSSTSTSSSWITVEDSDDEWICEECRGDETCGAGCSTAERGTLGSHMSDQRTQCLESPGPFGGNRPWRSAPMPQPYCSQMGPVDRAFDQSVKLSSKQRLERASKFDKTEPPPMLAIALLISASCLLFLLR